MSTHNTKKKIIIVITLVTFCFLISGVIWYRSKSSDTKEAAITVEPTAFNSKANKRLLEAEPHRKILLFSFELSGSNDERTIKLSSLEEFTGHPEAVSTNPGDYSFSVIEDGNPVYTTNFSIHPIIVEELNKDGTIKRAGTKDENSYAIRTPRFKDGATYIIRDANGKIVAEDTVRKVQLRNNKPEYKTFIAD